MDGANMQASMNNLTQVDRIQQDRHTLPIVHQEQNADIAKEEAYKKSCKPTEIENTENKIIDPEERRKSNLKRKNKSNRKKPKRERPVNEGFKSGHIIDYTA